MMEKHFVVFESPGTFFNEMTEKPIDSWDVELAKKMAHSITERYNATPFAFYFTTRQRKDNELDSREVKQSGRYFLGGTILTAKEIEQRTDRDYSTLLANMRCNGWNQVVENKNSWTIFQPLAKDDVVLDWAPRKKKAA